MRNLISGLVVAVSAFALAGCGVSAADVVGTWNYDDGSKATTSCDNGGDATIDYSGTSLTFAAGTDNDLVITSISGGGTTIDFAALGCEPGYNLEGGQLVVGTGEGTSCTTDDGGDDNVEVTTTGELTWSVESATHMTLGGTETSTYHAKDGSFEDYTCTTTQTGGLTKGG